MSDTTESTNMTFNPISEGSASSGRSPAPKDRSENANMNAASLESVFDVPVRVSVVLGTSRIEIADLMKLDVGSVVELDRKVGESIDIFVSNRLVARGEVVLVEEKLGVTLTEIIKSER
jgi:flagellar motor switch protein FliN/FliY